MIKMVELTKRYGTAAAVDDVSLEITADQMVSVIGRSGAGKSTLLRMVNRLTQATSGAVLVHGRDVLDLRGAEMRAWQRDCAMIFQQFNLVPRLDVITNVMLGRANRHNTLKSVFKIFSEQDIGDALDALHRLGMAEQALQRAETLSGGQQQRVAIARALMQAPKVILADEPIASLDPLSAEIVMTSLRDIHEREGISVICNLHTLDTARQYCDRVIGMREGKVVFDGRPDELTRAAARDIYGGDEAFNEAVTSTSMPGAPAIRATVAGAPATVPA